MLRTKHDYPGSPQPSDNESRATDRFDVSKSCDDETSILSLSVQSHRLMRYAFPAIHDCTTSDD